MAIFVLIHGGIQGGWVWKRVIPLLRAAGHDVYAPTLTGCGERAHLLTRAIGLETHIQDVVNVLEYEDLHDVMLVGHSYGGQVITGVADLMRHRLAHLIYLDACVPQPGQSCLNQWTDDATAMDEHVQKHGDGWMFMPMDPREFGVTDESDLLWLAEKDTPHPYKTFQDPIYFDPTIVESIPRTYIQCIGDQPPPAEPPSIVKGMRYRTIASGHAANVTAPKELTELLLKTIESQ